MGAVTLVQLALGVNSIAVKCDPFGMDRFWADRRGPLALSLVALPDLGRAWNNPRMSVLRPHRQRSIIRRSELVGRQGQHRTGHHK